MTKKCKGWLFLVCVVKVVLESKEQAVSSRYECFCSSDVALTGLDADELGRIKRFETGQSYGEELVYKLCSDAGPLVQKVAWGLTYGDESRK